MAPFAKDRKYEVLVYGAAGFTGRLVSRYIAERSLFSSWCVAGRTEESLFKLRDEISRDFPSAPAPGVVVAGVNEAAAATSQAQICIACAGPYAICGLPVLEACIGTNTHYVDVTGEPLFLHQARAKFHDTAREFDLTAVVCCGFDCVPTEELSRRLLATVPPDSNAVMETFLRTSDRLSSGTIHTLLNSLKATPAAAPAKKSGEKKSSGAKPKRLPWNPTFRRGVGWLVPLPSADPHVVRMSASERSGGTLGLQYLHWYVAPSFFSWLKLIVSMIVLKLIARFDRGGRVTNFLFPPRNGPSAKEVAEGSTTITGTVRVINTDGSPATREPPTMNAIGTTHTYGFTAAAVCTTAKVMLESIREGSGLVSGVLTPLSALSDSRWSAVMAVLRREGHVRDV